MVVVISGVMVGNLGAALLGHYCLAIIVLHDIVFPICLPISVPILLVLGKLTAKPIINR